LAAQIRELRFDDRLWRLDWLGRIARPTGSESEPRIAVYLSELQPAHRKVLSNESLAEPRRHHVAEVKIGQLPLLPIGSVWRDGIRQPPNEASDELEITAHHQQFDLVRFDGQIQFDGESVPLLPASRYRIGLAASRQVAASWLAIAYDPTQALRFVALPSTALFQRCMCTSPNTIRHLIYGRLDKVVDPRSTLCGGSPSTYYLNLFKDFKDTEAPFLANLAADPIALSEYRRMRGHLAAAAANFDPARRNSPPESDPARRERPLEPHIKLSLPFSNPVQMRLRGKYLRIDREGGGQQQKCWGFLATEILDMKVRLVFDRLVIDRKNDARQGENADDADLPVAYRSAGRQGTEAAEPIQPITSEGDPARNHDALSLAACGGIEAVGLEVVKDPKTVQAYRAQWARDDSEPSGVGTTGEPVGVTSPLADVDIDSTPITSAPVTLEQFLEVLDLLEARDLQFESIPVATIHRRIGRHIVNYLPRSIKGVRSWHLTSEGARAQARGYVVAELHRRSTWHYLIELERKGADALALAHIRHHDGLRIDRQSLQWFMVDVAKANGWTAAEDYRHWIYQSIRHTPSRGAEPFVQAILSKL
jgi:hypothetical protein